MSWERGPADGVGQQDVRASGRIKRFAFHAVLWSLGLVSLALVAAGLFEANTSVFESKVFSRLGSRLTFKVASGENSGIQFPSGGPQDKRLGYSQLPGYLKSLKARNYLVTRQAAWSPELEKFTAENGYAMYREKENAGLVLRDHTGASFYRTSYPERVFAEFRAVPPLVVETLLFIEDRSLLDPRYPNRNPAVNWKRFALASAGQAAGWLDPQLRQGGASTLVTQIEKFRHYPDGRTRTVHEKLQQMIAASTRSYLDGPDTMSAQQRILVTYLDSTPLSSRTGYGEIIGIGDGLWTWYGTDLGEASRALSGVTTVPLARKAEVYKQVLSLLLAQRRPFYYLVENRLALAALTDQYLRSLADAGVIGGDLKDAALAAELKVLAQPPALPPVSFVERKAAGAIRTEMLQLLGTPSLYDLDRLDLTATTSLDSAAQQRVSEVLSHLDERGEVAARGLVGFNLLGSEDPARVSYSVVLYERGADRNYVRVRADSLDQPFDINSGAKLILGSTAKLRTTITYLGIITELHDKYRDASAPELNSALAKAGDPLTKWAVAYLAGSSDRSLQPMLDAAMLRRYSANPSERFFTGGGAHVFENFERSENREVPTVEDALTRSINLAFVRVMRDIRSYYTAELARSQADGRVADLRQEALRRFADQEGRTYLNRFYDDFRGRKPDEMLHSLATRAKGKTSRLAVMFRSLDPDAPAAELRKFLAKETPKLSLSDRDVEKLFASADPERYSLVDRAFLARVHPLQLWLAAYLDDHPTASRAEVIKASEEERQEAYTWLFKTRSTRKQDVRIRIVSEEDAFGEILKDWHKQGYPFDSLVPSLATVLGSSGDRPDALAHLMGLIVNDGVELPTVGIEELHFAGGTPYETSLALKPSEPKRVLAPEIARTVRRVLMTVVADGTATRLKGTYVTQDGRELPVGGKTGTGDNRFKSFGPGQHLLESRAVDRTATFVFFIGDRFFGTVTAYVAGAEAANYHFTSALAVQLLKSLAPQLEPLIDRPGAPELAERPENGTVTLVSSPAETTLMHPVEAGAQ